MDKKMSWLILPLLLSALSSGICSIVNKEVTQVIDGSGSIVRYSADIKASNVAGEYQLIFQNEWSDHISFLSVSSKGNTLLIQAPKR
jgi:hypothetical protein